MEANTVSAVTELLVNILLGSFSLLVLSWILVGVQEFINNRKREKREEESAKRDAEYHEQRMKDFSLEELMKNLEIDIETYSSVSLQKCGVYKYAESPDFEILLFGYSVDGGEVTTVDLACGEKLPAEILNALTDDQVTKWAFNAQFERVCLSRYLSDQGVSLDPFHDQHPLSTACARYLNPEAWKCSMVWSAYFAGRRRCRPGA